MSGGLMQAIEISEPGGPGVLRRCERPVPEPKPEEVLIKVRSAGVNRPDVLQREGGYPPPPGASDLPGLEVAGEIAATGSKAGRFTVGQRVCALTAGGGYAEYVCVDEGAVLPIPAGYTYSQAAALPENYFTVWHNVFQRGGLQAGESILVHGGSSGIGTTAIQLAKSSGATVFTTAGTDEKCDACVRLGASLAINYREKDFVAEVRAATEGNGVNVILDMVGGDYIDRNFSAAAIEGRIVQIAFLGGAKTEANFSKLMVKRLVLTGSTLRPRSDAFKAQIARDLEAHVWPLLETGKVAPVIDRIYPLAEAWRAHERMEQGGHVGKILLDVA